MIKDNATYRFLIRPRVLTRQIQKINSEIMGLTYAFALPKAIRYDKDNIQVSPEDPMSKYIERKTELEAERKRLQRLYFEALNDIEDKISLLESPGAQVIYHRFIGDSSFAEIADMIHKSERQMYRDYNRALDELSELLKMSADVSKCQ